MSSAKDKARSGKARKEKSRITSKEPFFCGKPRKNGSFLLLYSCVSDFYTLFFHIVHICFRPFFDEKRGSSVAKKGCFRPILTSAAPCGKFDLFTFIMLTIHICNDIINIVNVV